MKESATMKFVGWQASDDDDDNDEADVQNWYIDQVFRDLQKDIAEYYNISESAASSKLYTEGLKIYCAMDENAQTYLENAALNIDKSNDSDLQIASTIMGYDGRVIATVGSSTKKRALSAGTDPTTPYFSRVLQSSLLLSTLMQSNQRSFISHQWFLMNRLTTIVQMKAVSLFRVLTTHTATTTAI